jgi:hypothetical protein
MRFSAALVCFRRRLSAEDAADAPIELRVDLRVRPHGPIEHVQVTGARSAVVRECAESVARSLRLDPDAGGEPVRLRTRMEIRPSPRKP